MTTELSIAVVGAGRIGKMHAEIFARTAGARLHGVVDRSRREQHWLRDAGLADARVYASAEEALADKDVEAVVIATSSDMHVELIAAATAAGKKVFCEKPVAFETAAIINLYRNLSKDAIVQIGFNRRFDPVFNALKTQLDNDALGQVYTYHITNRDPRRPPPGFVGASGGMLVDFNIHDFDMLAFLSDLADGAVREVFVRGSNLLQDEAMLAAGDIDTVMISAALNNGTLANIDCTRESGFGYDQRLEVLGERGGLRADNVSQVQCTSLSEAGFLTPPLRENFITRFYESYVEQARVFVAVCKDERACPVGLRETANALAACEAGARSLASGKSEPVFIPQF